MVFLGVPVQRYNQWVLWNAFPSPNRPGKTDKFPLHPVTGCRHNAHDPAVWLSHQQALDVLASGVGNEQGVVGRGVGFVFSDNDPFFFIDLDHSRTPDGRWNALSTELCTLFAGAYVEVSLSGEGLHIIGSYDRCPDHRIELRGPGLDADLYTTKRFVACTGYGATGSSAFVAQSALEDVTTRYFAPVEIVAGAPTDWTTTPVPEYTGPADDNELIAKMLRASTSAQGAFLGKATLAQLWEGGDAVDCYGGDVSATDAALLSHLSFWTGKDCERMDRLFRASGLMRDKWDRGAGGGRTYGQRSILTAVSITRNVYSQQPTAPTAPATPAAADRPETLSGTQLLTTEGLLDHFKGMTYITSTNTILTPDGSMLDQSRFDNLYGGWQFMMTPDNVKPTKSAWEAFCRSQAIRFPKCHDLCFRPECPPGEVITEEGRRLVNTYSPITTPSRAGDPSRFTDHLARMLPNPGDQAIMLAYMAAVVQHPGVKFQWAPLLVGMEGNGKSMITRMLEFAVGKRYSHFPNAQDIDNKFNAWLQGKLFVALEEVYTADRQSLIETLKPLITNDRVDIQGKGQDQRTGDNRANFVLCSNHKDAIRKTGTDRRYAIFFTAQQEQGDLERDGMSGSYFPELYNWLRAEGFEIVNDWLRGYAIPAALNPAVEAGGQCHRAPETSSHAEAMLVGLGGIEQEVAEAISEGRPGFQGGWISSKALSRLLEEKRVAGKIPRNKRAEMLRKMGYITHPAMPGGRCASIIPFEDGKPVLYVMRGSLASQLPTQELAVKRYIEAQGVGQATVGGWATATQQGAP